MNSNRKDEMINLQKFSDWQPLLIMERSGSNDGPWKNDQTSNIGKSISSNLLKLNHS
jgi:hypothetical protein